MRGMLTLGLVLLALNARAQEHFIDGGVLYERLLKRDPASITYIFGVYDAIQIVQYHAAASNQYFCAPSGVTGIQLVEGMRRFLEAEPAMRELPAGILVL